MEASPGTSELEALLSLLDETDESNFRLVKDKILSYGPQAIPMLEKTWENSFNNLIQDRIEELIHQIHFQDLQKALTNWVHFEPEDLLKGYMILTRYQYPDLDEENLVREVNKMVQDIWLELNENLTGLEKVKIINQILFETCKFSGNSNDINNPQNIYLNHLLETKKGNPLSLGVLYLIVARSLKLPVYGVDLPQHFVLAYLFERADGEVGYNSDENVLFYINPFNRGAVFTRQEIEQYIQQLKLTPRPSYFGPCHSATVLRRLIVNLIQSYEKLDHPGKVRELEALLKAFG